MVAPRHIFLDTSIIEKQGYNFSSRHLMALIEASKSSRLTLLIPGPTESEIVRHISEHAEEAVKAVKRARKEAPFLGKWNRWPTKEDEASLKEQLIASAHEEYGSFKRHFTVVPLGYDLVDLPEIMAWYDQCLAPFAPGEKRKEFPDAIAISALLAYARSSDIHIAVVSADKDFEKACSRHDRLNFFASVDELVQVLLHDQKRVAKIKELLEGDLGPLRNSIADRFPELYFYPVEDPSGDVEDVSVDEIEIDVVNPIQIGEAEAMLSFAAHIEFSAHVSFDDPDSCYRDDDDGELHSLWQRAGTVKDSKNIIGTAIIELSPDWDEIMDVVELEIDKTAIGVQGYPPPDSHDFFVHE